MSKLGTTSGDALRKLGTAAAEAGDKSKISTAHQSVDSCRPVLQENGGIIVMRRLAGLHLDWRPRGAALTPAAAAIAAAAARLRRKWAPQA